MSVTFHLTENAVLAAIPPEPLLGHPGSAGFNALVCPTCGDRCGNLFDGVRCLACEVGWTSPQFRVEVETDVLSYTCRCGRQWPVLIERSPDGPWAGQWVIVRGDDERCPGCGQFGACDEDDPDAFWNAAERAPQEEDDGEQTVEEWHAELWAEYRANAL